MKIYNNKWIDLLKTEKAKQVLSPFAIVFFASTYFGFFLSESSPDKNNNAGGSQNPATETVAPPVKNEVPVQTSETGETKKEETLLVAESVRIVDGEKERQARKAREEQQRAEQKKRDDQRQVDRRRAQEETARRKAENKPGSDNSGPGNGEGEGPGTEPGKTQSELKGYRRER